MLYCVRSKNRLNIFSCVSSCVLFGVFLTWALFQPFRYTQFYVRFSVFSAESYVDRTVRSAIENSHSIRNRLDDCVMRTNRHEVNGKHSKAAYGVLDANYKQGDRHLIVVINRYHRRPSQCRPSFLYRLHLPNQHNASDHHKQYWNRTQKYHWKILVIFRLFDDIDMVHEIDVIIIKLLVWKAGGLIIAITHSDRRLQVVVCEDCQEYGKASEGENDDGNSDYVTAEWSIGTA